MCVSIISAICEYNDKLASLLYFSIHNTKPVNIFISVTEKPTFTKKSDRAKKVLVEIYCLRVNMIDDYKYVIVGVAVVYQFLFCYTV